MLKSSLSNGYSAQVRGWLLVSGVHYELAQVGPDFCILREPISFTPHTHAELIVEIDGDRRVNKVRLADSKTGFGTRIQFLSS